MVLICDRNSWTYHQYKSENPDWFLSLLSSKINIEQAFEEARHKNAQQQLRNKRR